MLNIQSKHEWAFLKSKAGFGQLVLYGSISKRIVCLASDNVINVKHSWLFTGITSSNL